MSSARRVPGRRAARINLPSVLILEARTLMAASQRVDFFAVPTLASSPGPIAAGPDGDVWFLEGDRESFTSSNSAVIGRVSPQGQVVEFPLPTPAGGSPPDLTGLTAGPDGAVWAVDSTNGRIDRIDHDGRVESFAVPGAQQSFTSSIVAGPDGNLWFSLDWSTLEGPGTISRITPAGVVDSFPLPAGGGYAAGLAAGPDGVWFTDPIADRIGKVDASGHVVEFGVPSPSNIGNGPGIAVGPDGDAYYFGGPTGGATYLIRVTPSGMTTPFALPVSLDTNLLAGSDGVYFLGEGQDGSHEFLRLDPDGTLTPVGSTPVSALETNPNLAFGPDGNLWFAEGGYLGGKGILGRVVLAATAVPAPGPTLVAGPPASFSGAEPVAPAGGSATLDLAGFRHSADVSAQSATIGWGDGSALSFGTLGPDPNDDSTSGLDPFVNGQVSGIHTYASAGSYAVTVTIRGTGPDGAAMTAEEVETVTAVDTTPVGQGETGLEAGTTSPFEGWLATFTTPTPRDASGSDFSATIDWGDGSKPTSGGFVDFGGPPSSALSTSFTVYGGHTYANAGQFTVRVTLTDKDGHAATTTAPMQVTPGSLTIATYSPLETVIDPSGTTEGYVALGTLTDFAGSPAGRTYIGTIDWGDGTAPTPATFENEAPGDPSQGLPSVWVIDGSHGYARAGSYTVSISVADNQDDSTRATLVATAIPVQTHVEGGQPFATGGGQPITATAGDQVSAIVASVVAPPSDESAADFKATVDWGDGTAPTPATVTAGDDTILGSLASLFDLAGSHTYATPGLYPVTITLVAPDGTSTGWVESIPVALDNAGTGTPATVLALTLGVAGASVAVATFTPTSPDAIDAEFMATVDWGDGSPAQPATIEPVTSDGSGAFAAIPNGHIYSRAGSFTVTTTVIGPDGIPTVIMSQATVKAATMPIVTPTPIPTPASPVVTTPIIAEPRPIVAPTPPATPATTPTPASITTMPTSRWAAWFVGPFSPTSLSAQFSKSTSTIATHPLKVVHPSHARPPTSQAGPKTMSKPKARAHPMTKATHHAAPRKHPNGPAGSTKWIH